MEQHVALFLDPDLQKTQFALKYMAAHMAIRPLSVHIFLRNGRREQGESVRSSIVAQSEAIARYLEESRLTLENIHAKGHFDVTEIAHSTPTSECIDKLISKIKAAGKPAQLILMEDGICKSPWTMEGEKEIVID